MIAPRCLVRGHDHALVHVREHVQRGTGDVAHTWECPTGLYRYFVLEGNDVGDSTIRFKRPRWGWAKEST